jgi:hypothetical protein
LLCRFCEFRLLKFLIPSNMSIEGRQHNTCAGRANFTGFLVKEQ